MAGPKTIVEDAQARARYEAMDKGDLLVEVALKLDGHLRHHRNREARSREDRRWLWGAVLGLTGAVVAASSLAIALGAA